MAFNTPPTKPRHPTTPLLPLLLLLIHLPTTTTAASITNGPQAPVTIAVSNTAWSTARDCAKNCVQYAGIWHCGYNAGYYGLGAGLGCGCASTNGCYCNTAYASSATSWISSCVSAHCEPVIGTAWGGDLDGMLGLYDGYCKTANVEGSTGGASWTPSTKTATSGGSITGVATAGVGVGNAGGTPVETGQSASVGGGGGGEKQGLSQSDVVALAASLGVGIPSLLIAGITLWVQLKKKKKRRESIAVAGGGGTGGGGHVSSDSSIISTHGQQQLVTEVRQIHNVPHYNGGYHHGNGAVPGGMGVAGQQGGGYYYDAAAVRQDGQYGQGHIHQDTGARGWFGYTK